MNRHKQSLKYALSVLTGERYQSYLEAIYLYGSCARGEQKYASDVDLLLKLRSDVPGSLLRSMQVDVMPDDAELPEVELKFCSGETFSYNSQFDKNIRKDGILLWTGD